MSGSLAELVKVNKAPSSTTLSPIGANMGNEFTSFTTIETVWVALMGGEPLSVTTMVIALVLGPCASVGIQEKTPCVVMLAPDGMLPVKVQVSAWFGRSESVAVTVNVN